MASMLNALTVNARTSEEIRPMKSPSIPKPTCPMADTRLKIAKRPDAKVAEAPTELALACSGMKAGGIRSRKVAMLKPRKRTNLGSRKKSPLDTCDPDE